MTTHERELMSPVALCDASGRLLPEAVGWSWNPMHTCNLPASLPRKKRWNYWAVNDDRFFFSATIADIDLAALAFAYYYERGTDGFAEKTTIAAPGSVPLPPTVAGDVVLDTPSMRVALTDEGAGTRIRVDSDDFRGEPLHADIVVARPAGHDTLNVVIPWSDEQFQFTSKQNTLPAHGTVTIGERRFEFGDGAYACLDFGRGVWPEETLWNWGAASGLQHGRLVGLNLGGQWTDGTGMTENGICIDGRLTKIGDDVRFTYDRARLMEPWRIETGATDAIALTFTPEYERISKAENGVYLSEVHQMFGRYHGTVTPDGEAPIAISNLWGWIEDHVARW